MAGVAVSARGAPSRPEQPTTGRAAHLPGIAVLSRPALALALLVIVAAHLWQLDDIPLGLYVDESSIGLNAAAVAETGRDEHGHLLPLYFRAFGEYKNPVYVYTAAALFGLLGVSTFVLRLTSFLFFVAALLLGLRLVARLFPGDRGVLVFATLSFGFLPLLFALSRISFEVIASVALFLAVLVAAHEACERDGAGGPRAGMALLLGLLLGAWLYTYSTVRMSAGLTLLALMAVYAAKHDLRAFRWVTVAFLLAAIPMATMLVIEPTALLGRFKAISYWDEPGPLWEKLRTFLGIYGQHWSWDFVLRESDGNPRHGGGPAGIVFHATALLAAIGAAAIVLGRGVPARRFGALLILLTVLAPVPAALTGEDVPNAVRAHLMAPCLVLLSCFGFVALRRALPARTASAVLNGWIGVEAALFVRVYFTDYSADSVAAMGSLGVDQVVAAAVAAQPEQIVFVPEAPASYTVPRFALLRIGAGDLPLQIEKAPTHRPSTCYIHYLSSDPFSGFPEPRLVYAPSFSAGFFGLAEGGPLPGLLGLRCY